MVSDTDKQRILSILTLANAIELAKQSISKVNKNNKIKLNQERTNVEVSNIVFSEFNNEFRGK